MSMISIILPVFNGEKTIQETIASVLDQTYSDFELIIINDGSNDSTLEVLANISDPRVKVFSYPNAGVAASRNRGLVQAGGEFIAFLDADDLWKPDKLEAQLKALEANPKAGVAYSWSDFIDESNRFLHPGRRLCLEGDVYADILALNFLEHGSNPLVRREAFEQVGSFEESLPPSDDWDMWIRLAAEYEFALVQSSQILYRVSANSQSSNAAKLEVTSLRTIERAFSQAPESLQPLKKRSLSENYKYLTFKWLEGYPTRQKGLAACRCFWISIKYQPMLLRQPRLMLIVIFKILMSIVLPSQQSQTLLTFAKRFYRKYYNLMPLN
ncbi:MAG: glycosyltransferase [Cyanothece sp. SIO1E1]|nr:glycosyltransferase [Cyanothece sp. SIO1E1]